MHITMESEYSSIALKVEICIVFAMDIPYILPIASIAIFNNIYWWIIEDRRWKIIHGKRFSIFVWFF